MPISQVARLDSPRKSFQARQGDEEDFLDDVIDRVAIPPAEQAVGEAGDLRVMASDDLVEVVDVLASLSQARVLAGLEGECRQRARPYRSRGIRDAEFEASSCGRKPLEN